MFNDLLNIRSYINFLTQNVFYKTMPLTCRTGASAKVNAPGNRRFQFNNYFNRLLSQIIVVK